MELRISKETLHFKKPARTSRGEYALHEMYLITLTDKATGKKGTGELAPLPDLSCDRNAYPDIPEVKRLAEKALPSVLNGTWPDDMLSYPALRFALESAVAEARGENLKEKIFEIYFEYFSLKIYETGNPVEIFKNENNNVNNSTLILSESINNITILKSIFFNLFDCINNFEYFKNSIIPLVIDIVYLSKNSEYYGNYIYILRCFFKYLKTSINTINSYPQELRQKKKLISDYFNIEMNYVLYAIIKY